MANLNLLDNDVPSFNKPLTNQEIDLSKPETEKVIRKEIYIDKFTTKRSRVTLTPSVCKVCALDIAQLNGFGGWDRVPEDKKTNMLLALQEHVKVIHPVKEDLIIDASELPKEWLGNNTVL